MAQPVGNMRAMTDLAVAPSPTRHFAPLAIILGIPLLFAAIFFYTSPVVLETGGPQGIFKCGSPSSPNTDAKNVCSEPEDVERNKALYSGLSGVALIGLGAVWLLRGQRDRDEEEWDDDEPRPRRRGDGIDLRGPVRDEPRSRSRVADDVEPDEDVDRVEDANVTQSRATRRASGKRRSVLRDDDFGEASPRRRKDDDWASDGWR